MAKCPSNVQKIRQNIGFCLLLSIMGNVLSCALREKVSCLLLFASEFHQDHTGDFGEGAVADIQSQDNCGQEKTCSGHAEVAGRVNQEIGRLHHAQHVGNWNCHGDLGHTALCYFSPGIAPDSVTS